MTDIGRNRHDFYQENVEKRLYAPIPIDAGEVTGWKELPIEDSHETLVALGAFSREAGSILTSSVYYGEHNSSPYIYERNKIDGALLSVFTKEKVAERLLTAQQRLPEGYHLLVFDAYRPIQVQESLYSFYYQQLMQQRPELTPEELGTETQKYVSLPSFDPTRPSPHNTGGSVDMTIVRLAPEHEETLRLIDEQLSDGDMEIDERVVLEMQKAAIVRQHSTALNFGTAFDHGGERAALAYFEEKLARGEALSDDEMEACHNRRLLYNVMSEVGMQPYYAEWWHFNAPESQMGARAAGYTKASYGAAEFDLSNAAHEELRIRLHEELIYLQERRMSLEPYVAATASQAILLETLSVTGEPRLAGQWSTEVIAPQFEDPMYH